MHTKWNLWTQDNFDHSRSISKSGTELSEGLFHLWYYTLLETVTDQGMIGFNVYNLEYQSDDENQYLEIKINDQNLKTFARLRKWLFAEYDGINQIADFKLQVIEKISELHLAKINAGNDSVQFLKTIVNKINNSSNLDQFKGNLLT